MARPREGIGFVQRGVVYTGMDALIKAMEARGHAVEVVAPKVRERWGEDRRAPLQPVTRVRVADEWVAFGISEVTKDERPPKPTWRTAGLIPLTYSRGHFVRATGELVLSMHNGQGRGRWNDRRDEPLENQLASFMVAVIKSAAVNRTVRSAALIRESAEAVVQERLAGERAAVEERRAEEERRRLAEKARAEDLHRRAREWTEAHSIRAFIHSLAGHSESKSAAEQIDAHWLAWARSYADALEARSAAGIGVVTGER